MSGHFLVLPITPEARHARDDDARVELEEERQRLADTTASTENDNLGELDECMAWSASLRLCREGLQRCSVSRSGLTLLADAEKALRWAAAPRTDCET